MFKKTILLAALMLASVTQAATTIDTFSVWNGSTAVAAWGESDTATYGQTFTTGSLDTVLNSFSFAMTSSNNNFKAYVGAWDGSKASNILWSSPVLNADTGYDDFDLIQINTNGLHLAANQQYVAFFSTSGLQTGSYVTNQWAYQGSDVYDGGGFVFFNNGNDASALTTQAWDGPQWWGQTNDLAFNAQLVAAPVPEPETYAMLLTGLGLMGAVARRRNNKRL